MKALVLASLLASATTATLASGCAASPASSAPSPTRCTEGLFPTGNEREDLARLEQRCGDHAERLGPPIAAWQGERDEPLRLQIEAGGPEACYRLYAVGGVGVLELDAAIFDLDRRVMLRDEQRGGLVVLPEDSSLCLPERGLYEVEIGVMRGKGPFVVEMRQLLRAR